MRTTVTLDDDLYRALELKAQKMNQPFAQVLNVALRAGLAMERVDAVTSLPFRVESVDCVLRQGIDPLRLNQLADGLAAAEVLESAIRKT